MHQIDAGQIRKVRIALSKPAFDAHGGFSTYKAKFEALLSVHYTAAAILHDRALTLAQFEPNRYDDPKLRSFAAQKVEVRADAGVSGSQAKVDVDDERRRDAVGLLHASARRPRKSAVARPDREQIPQLRERRLCPTAMSPMCSAPSTGWRISARCAN